MNKMFNIYKFVLRYPVYIVLGVLFLLLFAMFSGVSITLVIPVFDHVFIANRTSEPIYTTFSAFFEQVRGVVSQIDFSFSRAFVLSAWKGLEGVFRDTDPWLLLQVICLLLMVLFLLKNLFFFLNRLMFVNLRGKTIQDIRNACYRKYLSQSYAFFNQNRVGDSIVRMVNDIDIVNNIFIENIFKILRDSTQVVIFSFIAMSLNARLFLVSLLIFPTFMFAVQFLSKKVKKYARKIQSKLSDMFSNIEEVLNSMRIVKAFCKEDFEFAKLMTINRQHFMFWRKSQIYGSFGTPIGELSGIFIGIAILFIGGADILTGKSDFTFGDFTAFLFAIFSMMHPLKVLAHDIAELRRAMVSVDRVSEIIEMKSDIYDSEFAVSKGDFADKIEFKDVSFSYETMSSEVLSHCNLEIKKGQKVAFVGASGSGKTTIANLINRMYDVTSGEILLDGTNVKDIKISELRKLFGVVTQDSILFSDTIEHNILYGSNEQKTIDDVKEACRFAFADEFIEQLPNGYQTFIHPHGSNFSGGQKQRLCIARAIIDNPPILIFDEATSALDTDSEQKVQSAIDNAAGNRTVIIIAHRLSTILSADNIVVMDKGEIVGQGTHEQLINTCQRYKHFYDLQFAQ